MPRRSSREPRPIEWAAWRASQNGLHIDQIAKQAKKTTRQVSRWIARCEKAIRSTPGYDAAQGYLEMLVQPSLENIARAIRAGNLKTSVKVVEGLGLLSGGNGKDGDFSRLTDAELVAEMLELAVKSGDKTVIAKVQRVRIPAGAIGSSVQGPDAEALDGTETPEA